MTARDEVREFQDAALNALEAGVRGGDLVKALNAVIRDYYRLQLDGIEADL